MPDMFDIHMRWFSPPKGDLQQLRLKILPTVELFPADQPSLKRTLPVSTNGRVTVPIGLSGNRRDMLAKILVEIDPGGPFCWGIGTSINQQPVQSTSCERASNNVWSCVMSIGSLGPVGSNRGVQFFSRPDVPKWISQLQSHSVNKTTATMQRSLSRPLRIISGEPRGFDLLTFVVESGSAK
jgi:hypothetical protein